MTMGNEIREVKWKKRSRSTQEGAGVLVRRAIGHQDTDELDPFLLLDEFGSESKGDYDAGFPSHPHRGFETVTYMLEGKVEHEDSTGRSGIIGPGDIQWMTAGSGIIHSEMPQTENGGLRGLQLWVNLPAEKKMTQPTYRGYDRSSIPEVEPSEGVKVKVIAGTVSDVEGPIQDIAIRPEYLDVTMQPESEFRHTVPEKHTAFAYMLDGEAEFGKKRKKASARELVVLETGTKVLVRTDEGLTRFILASGKPLGEPVAWRGSVVMNTQEEVRQAFSEVRNGTFVKAQ
ncbi:MAG: pirin family protein [Candidatus Lokiarchaeota archaeon]|nr:pirin family protein [Candidatus Lokiarchaeota archaeon]